ncbi:hypothetical protein [Aneurinibacillus terranovensis]|uniref:hypothetical protein n=1 Tax=Aneurinibacillus terranovensis TaxID=278991 RepID=UPI000429E985|nr:hypothetical protein [Aneurinibacillus terranovensis]
MSTKLRVFIPVIMVTLASLILIVYSLYLTPHPSGPPEGGNPPNPPAGMPPKQNNGFDFTLLGNIAIACAAVSYWWFLFKTKLSSPSKPLKKVVKRLYSIHTYTGWSALVLIIIHGGYYLITDLHNSKLLTGVAAFCIMLALAIYGWLYKRVRNKFMRTSHFILSNIWLLAVFIHAGGFFIVMVVITVVLWVILRIMDSIKDKKTLTS